MNKKQTELADKLKSLTPEQRDLLLAKLKAKKASENIQLSLKDKPISLVERHVKNTYPLSFSQQRLWFLSQLEGRSSAYNIAGAFSLKGQLNIEALQEAVNILVKNNETLRTNFIETEEGPLQLIHAEREFILKIIPITSNGQDEQLKALANAYFDLTSDQLFNIVLLQIADDEFVLSVVIHHIVSDGWSNQLMMSQLSRAYQNLLLSSENSNAATSVVQYVDFAHYHTNIVGQVGESQLKFWQQALNENVPLAIATDFSVKDLHKNDNIAQARIIVDTKLKQEFNQCCQQQGVTEFSGLLSIFQILLRRYSSQNNFSVGIPTSGRIHEGVHNVLGFFVNSLAIPCQVTSNDCSFSSVFSSVANFLQQAQQHQDVPFEHIVENLPFDRASNITPIFQTFFAYDAEDVAQALNLPNIKSAYINTDLQHKKFDINFTVKATGDSLDCLLEYDANLYSGKRMASMVQHFVALLQSCVNDVSSKALTATMLSSEEIEWQEKTFNNTQHSFLESCTVQALFQQAAAEYKNNVAVKDSVDSLTYQQLDEKSNQLSAYLSQIVIPADEEKVVIAVCLDRGVNLSVALMAVLKSNAAYLPCLSDMPKERLAYILNDAGVSLMLCNTQSETVISLICTELAITVINIDTLNVSAYSTVADNTNVSDNAVFNIIYTSGSTGKPKGVIVPQRGIVNRLEWMQAQYPITASDKFIQKTPFNFDVSVWELFWPLLKGASLYFMDADAHKDPQQVSQVIQQEQISVCHFVPSMLEVFVQVDDFTACTSLSQVFTSGEALLQHQVDLFLTGLPDTKLSNLYGPTEASIDVSWHNCKYGEVSYNNMVSIGQPIYNTQLLVLDSNKQLLPKGCVGSLYIGGVGLALAYKNLPEQTTASFVTVAFQGVESRFYLSGDLARINTNDELDYFGRTDHQVKLRGLRVELGEIEQALLQIDIIEHAIVSIIKVNQVDQIIAYIVVGSDEFNKNILRQELAVYLPEYMLPFDYVSLLELPLSANGKLNRKALPEYQTQKKIFIAPRHSIDEQLVKIVEDLLNVGGISINDNFFELGGHSLLATRLLMQVKGTFHIELTLKSIFELSTIADLSDLISVLLPASMDGENEDDDEFEEGVL